MNFYVVIFVFCTLAWAVNTRIIFAKKVGKIKIQGQLLNEQNKVLFLIKAREVH